MVKKRKNIPTKIEKEVMGKSEGKCYCGKQGDEIHHLDGNPANNEFDNLVLLCIDHHDDAEVKGGRKRRLKPSQIKQARDKLYLLNHQKDKIALKHYTGSLKKVSEENLFRAALDANITIEIIKIRNEYYEAKGWETKASIISKLSMYCEHSSYRIANEVFDLLEDMSHMTRWGMPVHFSDIIMNMVLNYFRYPETSEEKKLTTEMTVKCANVALGMIYDALIKINNLAVACSGLEILKFLYLRGKAMKNSEMLKTVEKQYNEISGHLARPDRTDLEQAKQLLKIYKEDLNKNGMGYPSEIPNELYEIIIAQYDK